jgi:hypothetical protein
MSMQFTPHFHAREFAVSASRPALVEPLPPALIDYARLLAVLALEPARVALGTALRITSGYRPAALNRAVGGSPTSQHLLAQAVDVTAPDLDALTSWLLATRPAGIGQVIRYPSFVHVALVGTRYPTFSPFRRVGQTLVAL